jgi:MFS family permease
VTLAAGIPAGHLADRHGPRGVYAATLLLSSVAMAAFCLVHGFLLFLAVACAGSLAQAASTAARGPIIQRFGGERPSEFRAYLRSVSNVGVSVGAVLAGWAVAVGTHTAYTLLIIGNAVSFAVCAVLVMCLPPVPVKEPETGPRWIALRDHPYLLLTALDGVMAIEYRVLTVAIPLWLVSETSAPHWSVSAVLLVNTVMVVGLQVRASRAIDTPASGGRAFRRAGFAFLVACLVLAQAGHKPQWVAMALLLGGVTIHTVGELWHAAGGFEVSFSLAPSHAVGQYQGVFGMGLGLGEALGPAVLTTLCIGLGILGWCITGVLFALTGLAVPSATRWAESDRTRNAAEVRTAGVT